MIMTLTDILEPESSELAKTVGAVPALQPVWTMGYVFAAILILAGFITARVMPEVIGLTLMVIANIIQCFALIGAGEGERGFVVLFLLATTAYARVSALLSPVPITIVLPGRSDRHIHSGG